MQYTRIYIQAKHSCTFLKNYSEGPKSRLPGVWSFSKILRDCKESTVALLTATEHATKMSPTYLLQPVRGGSDSKGEDMGDSKGEDMEVVVVGG